MAPCASCYPRTIMTWHRTRRYAIGAAMSSLIGVLGEKLASLAVYLNHRL